MNNPKHPSPGTPLLLYQYETDFIIRFLASFLTVSIMAYAHEYSRFKANLAMLSLRQSMERKARTDALTGLPNRRDLDEQLRQADRRLYAAKRNGKNRVVSAKPA